MSDGTPEPGVEIAVVGGTPTDEEAAAVVAAVQVVLSAGSVEVDDESTGSSWRFSNRWWKGPVAVRRGRPGLPFARDW